MIIQAEKAGFPVVAMVSDLGTTNVTLWNSLGIDIDNSAFVNPVDDNREVHVFADAPHLIKLIRNNFLDHGFVLSGDRFAHYGSVRELIMKSKSDLQTAHKLSEKHINVMGMQRMNVKLAVQLLSETT